MRHTDCAVTWNKGPLGPPGAPPLAPTLATSGPLTRSPSLPQVSLSPELGPPETPEAQSSGAVPLHTLEITLSLPWEPTSLLPLGVHPCPLRHLPLSAQLGLDQMGPQSSSRQDSPGEWDETLPESLGRAMEGTSGSLCHPKCRGRAAQSATGWHLAGQEPGEQLFPLSCRAAGRDRDMARLMGSCSCPGGRGLLEGGLDGRGCSEVRQRAEEAMMGSQVLAGPQLFPKEESFPNCLPWQARGGWGREVAEGITPVNTPQLWSPESHRQWGREGRLPFL